MGQPAGSADWLPAAVQPAEPAATLIVSHDDKNLHLCGKAVVHCQLIGHVLAVTLFHIMQTISSFWSNFTTLWIGEATCTYSGCYWVAHAIRLAGWQKHVKMLLLLLLLLCSGTVISHFGQHCSL